MKGIWLYTILILTLFLATSLLLLLLNFSSSFGNLIGIRIFVFSVFGTAICAIFGKTSPLSDDELDGVERIFNYFVLEDDGKLEIEKDYSDVDDEDENDSYGTSDGYEEDNDDNGSTDYEVESYDDNEEEKEEVDEDLIRRSDEFISKVKERWRQEMARDQEL